MIITTSKGGKLYVAHLFQLSKTSMYIPSTIPKGVKNALEFVSGPTKGTISISDDVLMTFQNLFENTKGN